MDTVPCPVHADVVGLALGSRDGPCINSDHEPTSLCSPLVQKGGPTGRKTHTARWRPSR